MNKHVQMLSGPNVQCHKQETARTMKRPQSTYQLSESSWKSQKQRISERRRKCAARSKFCEAVKESLCGRDHVRVKTQRTHEEIEGAGLSL
jgi:hypothetical protein